MRIFGEHGLDHILAVQISVLRAYKTYMEENNHPPSYLPAAEDLAAALDIPNMEALALSEMIKRHAKFYKMGARFYQGQRKPAGNALPEYYRVRRLRQSRA